VANSMKCGLGLICEPREVQFDQSPTLMPSTHAAVLREHGVRFRLVVVCVCIVTVRSETAQCRVIRRMSSARHGALHMPHMRLITTARKRSVQRLHSMVLSRHKRTPQSTHQTKDPSPLSRGEDAPSAEAPGRTAPGCRLTADSALPTHQKAPNSARRERSSALCAQQSPRRPRRR